MADSKNVLFLASGRGSNFQSFVDHVRLNVLKNVQIKALICNHSAQKVVEKARTAKISAYEIEGVSKRQFSSIEEKDRARLAFDNDALSICKNLSINYVVLAGFDQVLTKTFTDNFPFRILNIHPAYDLKQFGGKNMVGQKVHESVISKGMSYSGCAVHFVTAAVDQGPVILKKKVRVLPEDNAETLEARILEQEHLVYPKALQLLVEGRVLVSEAGTTCFVDEYSNNWDIEWEKRQEAYIDFANTWPIE